MLSIHNLDEIEAISILVASESQKLINEDALFYQSKSREIFHVTNCSNEAHDFLLNHKKQADYLSQLQPLTEIENKALAFSFRM